MSDIRMNIFPSEYVEAVLDAIQSEIEVCVNEI